MNILMLDKKDLSTLESKDVTRQLLPEEIVHMANVRGAHWQYNYRAANKGKVGMHALLKSGLHSDGFFVSRILLEAENIRLIIAAQMVMKLREILYEENMPDFIVGIPDGATKLGEDIGKLLGVDTLEMKKVDGQIIMVSKIEPKKYILMVEDFCTRGTGFKEAAGVIKVTQPDVKFIPYNPVIINRGGLKTVDVDDVDQFTILPIVNMKVQDWEPDLCPLCRKGSIPIKPKVSDENWVALTTSQL